MKVNRREFLKMGTLGAAAMVTSSAALGALGEMRLLENVKPIEGAWFEFQHLNPNEGTYWNKAMAAFTADQWHQKVFGAHALGMEYLIIQEIAIDGRAFYPSKLTAQYELACRDPLEAVLSAADGFEMKILIGNGFFGDPSRMQFLMRDRGIRDIRTDVMREVVDNYGHHPSLRGWYYSNEISLSPYFQDYAIEYVGECSRVSKELMPSGITLIAPYNVRAAASPRFDRSRFVHQLTQLDVDAVAYQDGVGVGSTPLHEDGRYFRILRDAHQSAGRARIWADMEVFYFQDKAAGNRNLLAASFDRVHTQMRELSPFVEKILCYEYTGIFNSRNTTAFAGDPYGKSVELYKDYKAWYDSYVLRER